MSEPTTLNALSTREGIVYRTLRDAQLGDLEQMARDVITALHLAEQLAAPVPPVSSSQETLSDVFERINQREAGEIGET